MNLKLLYFGTFHSTYPGNTVLIEGLRKSGVTVDICHVPVGETTRSKYHRYKSSISKVFLAFEYFFANVRLFFKYLKAPQHDAIVIGYWGQMDTPLASLLAKIRNKPLIFNPMMSLYDVVVLDRKIFKKTSPVAGVIRYLDQMAFSLSDIVFLDSEAHIRMWRDVLGCDEAKIRKLYLVSADPKSFFPRKQQSSEEQFEVLFYGTYTPAQGVDVIVKAAKQLENEGVEFTIIGYGQETEKVKEVVSDLRPDNVTFIDWVDFELLPEKISHAHVGLGMFGKTDKVNRNFPYKVVQCNAMGVPVITSDSESIREVWTDGEDILLCKPGDPESLADAISLLKKDKHLRDKIGEGGLELFRADLTPETIGGQARQYIEEILQ